MKKYVLPDLAYEYSALEPHYAARPLEVHHSKHHAAVRRRREHDAREARDGT